jgi:hypothetical protein
MSGAHVLMVADSGEVPGANDEEKAEFLEITRRFEFDVYYPFIQEWTPSSVIVEFTREEASALRNFNRGSGLSTVEQGVFEGFKDRLDRAIQMLGPSFIRLSTRSPKDSVDKMPEIFNKFIVEELLAMRQVQKALVA